MQYSILRIPFSLLLVCSGLFTASSAAPTGAIASAPIASVPIVVGFLGGFVGRQNSVHYEVQLAQHLSKQPLASLRVLTFENRHGEQALQQILHLLDVNDDGKLSAGEKSAARIAIYGHSWGASETVTLARALQRDQIPVLLTVQVDSVRKPGEDDTWIPDNVLQAVNFFQRDGLLHGRAQIRATDTSRTEILGNFQEDYKNKPVSLKGYPWYARLFMKPHIEIESDPAVWQKVEALIRTKLLHQ